MCKDTEVISCLWIYSFSKVGQAILNYNGMLACFHSILFSLPPLPLVFTGFGFVFRSLILPCFPCPRFKEYIMTELPNIYILPSLNCFKQENKISLNKEIKHLSNRKKLKLVFFGPTISKLLQTQPTEIRQLATRERFKSLCRS